MSYTLTIREEPQYLYIQATGARSRAMVFSLTKDCVAECKQRGYGRVLVDIQRLEGALGALDAFHLVTSDMAQIRQGYRLKVAISDLPANKDRLRFFENVAFNNGLDLRVFSDVDAALKWLLADIASLNH
jgi:hypothetical protein